LAEKMAGQRDYPTVEWWVVNKAATKGHLREVLVADEKVSLWAHCLVVEMVDAMV